VQQIPETAAHAVIRGLDGKEHELRALWAERPAVLVFLRHFGCLFCREQAAELDGRLQEIRERGAELVFIGNGNRHFARGFQQDHGIKSPLYVDTKRDSYRALGMKRGFFATLGSRATWRNMLRARKQGFRQGLTRGDAWQNGGVVVVEPGGRVAFSYLSREAGDHPPAADVLAALGPGDKD
jgi:peroxiredoxin